ncbi:tyrosine-type recombinase/integrase [Microbacterium sp.]|uniref:tyrosine-type recombinase/integrase n=1 Tax=Microbacterium sp. TaxID=51671 RepID=UPI003A886D09
MPRARKQPGELGKVTVSRHGDGYRARTRIRDGAGELHLLDKTAATKGAAIALVEDTARRIWSGVFVEVDGLTTVADLARVWLRDPSVRGLKVSSQEAYEDIVRLNVIPRIGAVPVSAMTPGMCDHFLRTLAADKSPSYARRTRAVLSLMLRIAVLHGALPSNPIREVGKLPSATPTFLQYTGEQLGVILRLLRAWKGRNPGRRGGGVVNTRVIEDVILICLGTSARPGEALAIRRQDVIIGPDRVRVHITGTITQTRRQGNSRQDTPKKERQQRHITVPRFTERVLRRLMAEYTPNPDGLLLVTRNLTPFSVSYVENKLRAFREAHRTELRAIGVDPDTLTPKAFRKTAATVVTTGANAEMAKLLLGHSDVRTTTGHYIAPDDEVPSITADLLDAAFSADTTR